MGWALESRFAFDCSFADYPQSQVLMRLYSLGPTFDTLGSVGYDSIFTRCLDFYGKRRPIRLQQCRPGVIRGHSCH